MAQLVIGSAVRRRVIGRVADFCPICRMGRPCRLVRRTSGFHMYWIPVGVEDELGHEVECEVCGIARATDPLRFVPAEDADTLDLEDLKERTSPAYDAEHAERVELERKRAQGTLTDEERRELLTEPFHVVAPLLKRDRVPQLSPLGRIVRAFAGAAVLALLVCVSIAGSRGTGWMGPFWATVLVAACGVGLAGTVVAMATAPAWYRRARIEPALVRALRPLRPTLDELAWILRRIEDRDGIREVRQLDAARLHRLLGLVRPPGAGAVG